jgi:hypothetical protein
LQQRGAERYAEDTADNKRQETTRLDRLPQLPHRDALDDERERGDQRCHLRRRQKMQPDRGSNDTEGKPGEPRDIGRGKRASSE